jgi:hypothetical protein
MRRFAAGLGFAMGLAWLFRRFRPRPVEEPAPADPAGELRRKLQESREDEPAPEPEEPKAPLDERRRAVHDRGREAIERMRQPDDRT